MVSYAEYPSTMTSGDFDLYPSQDDYAKLAATTQAYMPATSYADGSYLTTFDSYPSVHAYSNVSSSQELHYSLSAPSHTIENMTPAGSPAHSMSYSFETMPRMISTASESDASIQSTSSSATGSPSQHPHYPEPWTSFDQGFNGAGAPESFESSGFEYHALVPADKLGFVGESTAVCSSPEPCLSPSPVSKAGPSFKPPSLPASVTFPLSPWKATHRRRSVTSSQDCTRRRKNSLLSHQIWPESASPEESQSLASSCSSQSHFSSPLTGRRNVLVASLNSSWSPFPASLFFRSCF